MFIFVFRADPVHKHIWIQFRLRNNTETTETWLHENSQNMGQQLLDSLQMSWFNQVTVPFRLPRPEGRASPLHDVPDPLLSSLNSDPVPPPTPSNGLGSSDRLLKTRLLFHAPSRGITPSDAGLAASPTHLHNMRSKRTFTEFFWAKLQT